MKKRCTRVLFCVKDGSEVILSLAKGVIQGWKAKGVKLHNQIINDETTVEVGITIVVVKWT